jgi:hypothetical protein
MKEYVGTAIATVLMNGIPIDEFHLARGLRQGVPLSPFLFLLVAKGFHMMMETMVINNIFTGYKVGQEQPLSISHLQFADDTLILGEISWANVRAMHVVLYLFVALSRLKVNFHKSEHVGVNVSGSWIHEVASILNCKVKSLPFCTLDFLLVVTLVS